MSIYNRYEFLKKYYPDYLIFVMNNKNKLVTFNRDLEIVKTVGMDNVFVGDINYIIMDNLDIVKKKKYLSNNYFYYFKIELVYEILRYIEEMEKGKVTNLVQPMEVFKRPYE